MSPLHSRSLPLVQVATLTEELENSRGGVRDQLKEKDAKINSLIEELGNSQAMLNDKVAELAEVRLQSPCAESSSCPTSWPPCASSIELIANAILTAKPDAAMTCVSALHVVALLLAVPIT